MFRLFFGAALALTLCSPGRAAGPAHPRPKASPRPPTVEQLYSLRARRRMASYLRLRLLEWREAGLERAAEAVERRIPVDELVPKPEPAGESAKH